MSQAKPDLASVFFSCLCGRRIQPGKSCTVCMARISYLRSLGELPRT
jgi:hypothetical protein